MRFRVAFTLIALVLAVAAFSYGAGVAGDDSTTVVAQFESAAPLVDGNQVKVDGVVVGTVSDMTINDEGTADVRMELDRSAMPLHQDATFTIRPVSLLGERYVDLERGDPQAPMLDVDRPVPVTQTASNIDLDEVLNAVDDPTGEGLAFLITTLGEGLQGNGDNAQAAISQLAPTMRNTEKLTEILKNHNALLNSLIEQVQPVAEAVATDDGKALEQVVDSADQLLAAAAAQQKALNKTLERLPGTLKSARATLNELSTTATQTTPTLKELRPVTDNLPQIAKELKAFSAALDPALAKSQPVLRRAEELLDAAAPVAKDLKAAGPGLASSVKSARPLVKDLTANRDYLFSFIRYWALTTNGYDGLSHYFRVNATISTETLTGVLPVSGPDKQVASSAPKSATPEPRQAPNALGDVVSGLLGPGGLLPLLPGAADPQKKSPTGLSKKQETNLLDFLLGGLG